VSEGELQVGDSIKFSGHTTKFVDVVQLMEVDNNQCKKLSSAIPSVSRYQTVCALAMKCLKLWLIDFCKLYFLRAAAHDAAMMIPAKLP
jgi:hypothetical protein